MSDPCAVADDAPATNPSITHVIFDMDGLLLDTEKFYTEVQENILARYNKTFEWSLKAKMMGMKAIEAARVFVEETGISGSLSAEDFLVEREDMLQNLFSSSELMPGAIRLIQHLHANGIPISVATGFEGGPVDPRKILVFEDAPSGVLAAKNAGMWVVMVPDPRLDTGFHQTADKVISSLCDFNPSEWGLPPF
ncbi:glutathione synthase [Orobanche minor]